jgi:hypothetical protein
VRSWALSAALLLSVSPANAATVTWEFEGVVREVRTDPAFIARATSLGVVSGATATGQITYEYPVPDLDPGSNGSYSGAGSTYAFQAGAYATSRFNGVSRITVTRDVLGPPTFLAIESFNGAGIAADGLFLAGHFWRLSLLTGDPSVFPDDSQPLAPPSLSDLRTFQLSDWLGGTPTTLGIGTGLVLTGASGEQVYIELTRLEAVPEPGLAALAGVTLLLLLAARLRRGRAA